MAEQTVSFPPKLEPLFHSARYKVARGGRGGGKSWGVARALVIIGTTKALRVLCAREFQNSISESVHALLASQIDELGLEDYYEIQNTVIKGRPGTVAAGTEFHFIGLRRNIMNVKSYEGFDVVWVEESQTVSKRSWDVLIPTIRKPGSEIWLTLNPDLEEDETYQRFVVRPPPDTVNIVINWQDNPWFPEVLRREMEHAYSVDPESADTIWGGLTRKAVEGAVFAKELAAAAERIKAVPYEQEKQVHTVWDLGYGDYTAIWFVQRIANEWRLIDYEQVNQTKLVDIVALLQAKNYVYGTDVLPHDARHRTLAGGGKSIQEQLEALGRKVVIAPDQTIEAGINAARTIFAQCWFDAEKAADGLHCLRHYRYEYDENNGVFKARPLHNWASHGADAFRYFAISTHLLDDYRSEGPIRPNFGRH